MYIIKPLIIILSAVFGVVFLAFKYSELLYMFLIASFILSFLSIFICIGLDLYMDKIIKSKSLDLYMTWREKVSYLDNYDSLMPFENIYKAVALCIESNKMLKMVNAQN